MIEWHHFHVEQLLPFIEQQTHLSTVDHAFPDSFHIERSLVYTIDIRLKSDVRHVANQSVYSLLQQNLVLQLDFVELFLLFHQPFVRLSHLFEFLAVYFESFISNLHRV